MNTPTAAFGEQRRVSAFGAAATPAAARRPAVTTWAPILVVVVAGTVLVGHFWRGAGPSTERDARLVVGAAVPASHLPQVEPLAERPGGPPAVVAPSAELFSGAVPTMMSSTSGPLPSAPMESTSGPAGAAAEGPPSSAAPRSRAGSGVAAAPSPETAAAARVGHPRQEAKAVKRRISRHRPARRAPARAVSRPSLPTIAPGALVDPMAPSIVPAPATPKPDCDPPFVIDSAGIKRFKLSCL